MLNRLASIKPPAPAPFTFTHGTSLEALPGGGLRLRAAPSSDYFQDPLGKHTRDNAAFLWLPAEGDFVAQAHVRPHWRHTWDAAALMARADATHWAKLCYEATDFGTRAVVSVVTQGISDDANGVDLEAPDVWLQVVRAGRVLAMHYAPDGHHWHMVRYFTLGEPGPLQVGLVAQSPGGPGADMDFLAFNLERATVKDLRAGV